MADFKTDINNIILIEAVKSLNFRFPVADKLELLRELRKKDAVIIELLQENRKILKAKLKEYESERTGSPE